MNQYSQRIPTLPRDEWNESALEVITFWEGSAARERGSNSNVMMTLANHPKLALAQLNFGKYLLVESTLSARQRELLIMRVAWRYHSKYQWAHHIVTVRRMGFTEAEIEALKLGPQDRVWNVDERAFLSAIDQLCESGQIEDAIWSDLNRTMNRHQIMDMLYSVGFFAMNAWAFSAMGIQLEPGFE